MKIEWIISNNDIELIQEFVRSQSDKTFVKNRITLNLERPIPSLNKEIFWKSMVTCLLTTQQRSGPKSSVSIFANSEPFPLSYSICRFQDNLAEFVEGTITEFGGLRRGKSIGKEVNHNLNWLEREGWQEIEDYVESLLACRRRSPKPGDKHVERSAAYLAIDQLKGFGPKQSRNLWQDLGFTRYEIPIDSRITKWFNRNGFPIKLSANALSDSNYYDFVMDGIQELCHRSEVLPCVVDAAIFTSFDEE